MRSWFWFDTDDLNTFNETRSKNFVRLHKFFSRKWKILEHQIPRQNALLVQENARGNADKNWEPDSSLCETDVNAHPRVVGDGGGRPPTTGSKIVAFTDRGRGHYIPWAR